MSETLAAFGSRLVRLAEERVAQRAEVEKRWLEDIYQYNGQYDKATLSALNADDTASKVYVNITRPKCNTVEARLIDMLFPTDDKNWGMKSSPVPEGMDPAQAGEACRLMSEEIDDQLKESLYNIKARDLIHQAVVLGTGVIKGPVVVGKDRRKWANIGQTTAGVDMFSLEYAPDQRPTVEVVDLWNFFPDMSVPSVEDGESVLERHYLTRRQMRKLLQRPGFSADAVRELLMTDPKEYRSTSTHMEELRTVAGLSSSLDDKRYEVWEYHGPVDKQDLAACGCEVDEEDPLQEYEGVVWFCGPAILKAVINPLETGEVIYSLFSPEKDDASPFGFGIPYLMRNSQKVVNAAWRMILANGGLSVGPQTILDRSMIDPADGDYRLRAKKVWYFDSRGGTRSIDQVFRVFNIPSNQGDLQNILMTAMKLADEETATPIIAQGENAPHVPDTARGMSILMNSANAVTRRAVKNFDDDISVPMIRRFYDWNMQFNDRNDIKGDYEVVARGTAALLVKEQQQQSLMQLIQLAAHPAIGSMLKIEELVKRTVQSMHLQADEIVRSEEELQEMAAQQQGQPQTDPIEQMKIEFQYKIHQEKMASAAEDRNMRLQEKSMEREIMMMRLATEENRTLASIEAQLKGKVLDNQTKRQNFVDEVSLKIQHGEGI